MLDQRADLATVQRTARHADPKTTSRYDRRGERVKRESRWPTVPFVDPGER